MIYSNERGSVIDSQLEVDSTIMMYELNGKVYILDINFWKRFNDWADHKIAEVENKFFDR